MSDKRLVRTVEDRMLLGVAGGIARYLDVDPVLVRLAFILLTMLHGWGLLIYVVMAFIVPEESAPTAKVSGFDEEEIIIE